MKQSAQFGISLVNKDSTFRPNSFIYSNGNQLVYYSFPSANKPLNKDFRIRLKHLKFYQQKKTKDPYRITAKALDIAVSQYHYYILFSKYIVVMSTISEEVIEKLSVNPSISRPQGLSYNSHS
jgi:hypothetical protein